MSNKHIIVIGGGAAGTAAASYLVQHGHKVTIVEKNNRLGGRINSVTKGGMTFELGAGFVTDSAYPNIFKFLQEKGLRDQLLHRKSGGAVMREGTAYPYSFRNLLLRNKPLSVHAKLALAANAPQIILKSTGLDVHAIWKKFPSMTKSISHPPYTNGKQELINYLWQPIFDGYFYWSTDTTSEAVLALIPKLLSGHTYILPRGLKQIPEAAAGGSNILLDHSVQSVQYKSGQYSVNTKGSTGTKQLHADGVVCALPGPLVSQIIQGLGQTQRNFFDSVHYSATAVLARTYQPSAHIPNQSIAFSRHEDSKLAAVTIVSDSKNTLVKSFASGAFGQQLCQSSDATIRETLLAETPKIPQLGTPTSEVIQRWPMALPEFSPEHIENLRHIATNRLTINGDKIVFAGDYLGGPFIEGAFTSGLDAAKKLHSMF